MAKQVVLLLFFLIFFPLCAQPAVKIHAVGARMGWGRSAALNVNNIIISGLSLNCGDLQRHLSLHAYIDYWNKTKHAGDNKIVSWRILGISAITKHTFPNQTNITPFVGGGVGFNFGKGESNATFDLAIHVLGGLSVPVTSRLNGLAEFKYSIDGADYFGIFLGMDYQIR